MYGNAHAYKKQNIVSFRCIWDNTHYTEKQSIDQTPGVKSSNQSGMASVQMHPVDVMLESQDIDKFHAVLHSKSKFQQVDKKINV
jgi:hypothetical protein